MSSFLFVWPVISANCNQLSHHLLSLSDQTMTLEKLKSLFLTYPSHLCLPRTWQLRFEKTLKSTLINSGLTRTWQLRKLSCKLSLLNCHHLLSLFDQSVTVEKTLMQPLFLTLINWSYLCLTRTWQLRKLSYNSLFSTPIKSHLCLTRTWQLRKLSCKLSALITSHLCLTKLAWLLTKLPCKLSFQLSSTLVFV